MPDQLLAPLLAIAVGLLALGLLNAALFTAHHPGLVIVRRMVALLRETGRVLLGKLGLIERTGAPAGFSAQQLDVEVETTTEDEMLVRMIVGIQYYVLPEGVYALPHGPDEAHRPITSSVFEVLKAQIPQMSLDDLFAKKDEIASILKSELALVMEGFGLGLLDALVVHIDHRDSKAKDIDE